MTWSGKLLAGTLGTAIGGPLAGLLAAGMGHTLDREVEGYSRIFRRQQSEAWQQYWKDAVFVGQFLLAGRLAFAGHMPPGEADACFDALAGRRVVTGTSRERARALFEEGQREDFPLTRFVNQLRRDTHRRRDLVEYLFTGLLFFFSFDRAPTPAQRTALIDIARRFALTERDLAILERIATEHRRQASGERNSSMDLYTAYATLEISSGATEAEVRRAYRVQMSRHHPDKLMHTQPSAEELARAASRSDRVRKAFEAIKRARGW